MTTWNPSSSGASLWGSQEGSIWDNTSYWDVIGNVATSFWDVSVTSWATSSSGSTVWTPA